jgi:hypothetical protein
MHFESLAIATPMAPVDEDRGSFFPSVIFIPQEADLHTVADARSGLVDGMWWKFKNGRRLHPDGS